MGRALKVTSEGNIHKPFSKSNTPHMYSIIITYWHKYTINKLIGERHLDTYKLKMVTFKLYRKQMFAFNKYIRPRQVMCKICL